MNGVSYVWDMSNTHLLRSLKAERIVLETLQRRRRRDAEFKAFASGGALVLTGLMLAAIFSLLTHRIAI